MKPMAAARMNHEEVLRIELEGALRREHATLMRQLMRFHAAGRPMP